VWGNKCIIIIIIIISGGQKVDITFIIDGSGSVYDTFPPVWKTQLTLFEKIINDINIGRDEVRVAVVTYADTARIEWNLDRCCKIIILYLWYYVSSHN